MKSWSPWNVAVIAGGVFVVVALLLLTFAMERVSALSCYIMIGAGVTLLVVGIVGSLRHRRR